MIQKSRHSEDSVAGVTFDISYLTRKMKKLNKASYDEFFHLYYRRLWAYLAVVASGDNSHIEEALQLTFEKVLRHVRVFDDEEEFWAWLSVIARNAYRDCQRKQMRFTRLLEAVWSNLVSRNRVISEEPEYESERLDNALLLLNDSELCLVKHKYFEGCSYREIAYTLGMTEKAVESKLARIRTKLRRLLLQEESDE